MSTKLEETGTLIATDNTECVPVPVAWLKRLVEIGATADNTSEAYFLKGYIQSATGFINK